MCQDEQCVEAIACHVDDRVTRDGRWYFARRRPADLQRVRIGEPLGIGKLSVQDAWAIHRERQGNLRRGAVAS